MDKKTKRSLSVVIPVYMAEDTIGNLVHTIVAKLEPYNILHEIILVDDGSQDSSQSTLKKLCNVYPKLVKSISLFKNFGEHAAVMCGLNHVSGDITIILDDDFQNPPSEIILLYECITEGGFDVVYSYYEKKQHNIFRNLISKFNSFCANKLLNKPANLYLSSFKVLTKSLINAIILYKGPYPYLDGLILRSTNNIGRQLCLHNPRVSGDSNYTLSKLFKLWLNASTGYSILPLRIASIIGVCLSIASILGTIYFVVVRLYGPIFFDNLTIPPGWASIIVCITFLSGIQLLILGLLGEYIGRILLTINDSPQYLIKEKSF